MVRTLHFDRTYSGWGCGRGLRELIERRGCELLYPPSYSPEYNPIEEAFAKIKDLLRPSYARPKVRTLRFLLSALVASGYTTHSGS
jgi:transposase